MYTTRSLVLLSLAYPALAQDAETIWGAVVVTTSGDHVPLLSPDYSILTPLGAQQMNDAGTFFRGRYISGGDTNSTNFTIAGIATDQIDNLQTSATAMYDIFIDQSTQAFMAGLYPPFDNSTSNNATTHATGATLFNGTNVVAPVSGLQYPQIYYASELDPNYIFLNGSANCPAFDTSYSNYLASSEYTDTITSTDAFYISLSDAISTALTGAPLNYGDAYPIWDFLNYGSIHSSSIQSLLSNSTDLAQARYLADGSMYQIYGNTTGDSSIRTIGGSALAANLLSTLAQNIETNASSFKLANYFTGPEPLISLTSLLGLPAMYSQFTGLPDPASSLVLELYSSSNITSFPSDPADLFVRFLFRNGTTNSDAPYGSLTAFPIFGRSAQDPDLSWNDFVDNMEAVAAPALNPGMWCTSCQSEALFCAYYTDGAYGLPSGAPSEGIVHKKQLSLAVAGVIGALVALVVAGLVLLAVMLILGIRFRRDAGGVVESGGSVPGTGKRRDMGGFKGSEKLASDVDLPSGGVFGATVDKGVEAGRTGGGHRRVESWELREGRGRAKASFESDRAGDGEVKAVEAV